MRVPLVAMAVGSLRALAASINGEGPLVEHGFAAPEVDKGVVAVGGQIPQDFQVALQRDFAPLQVPQVLAVEKPVIAPLAAGMAAQIAEVGDPEAQLADLVGFSGLSPGIEQIKEPLFALESRQLGADPGMFRQAPEVFDHHPQRDSAPCTHENLVPR